MMGLCLDTLPRIGRELSWDQGVALGRYRYDGVPLLHIFWR